MVSCIQRHPRRKGKPMTPPVIPSENPDLTALVRAGNRRFLTKWLVTTALTTTLAAACFSLAARAYGLLIAILLALTLILLPFLLCGGIAWVTDKGFTGTVKDPEFSVRLETRDTVGMVTTKGIGRKRVVLATAGRSTIARSPSSPMKAPTKPAPSASPETPTPFPCAKGIA